MGGDIRLQRWLSHLARKDFVTRPQVPDYARSAIESLLFQGAVLPTKVNGVLRYQVTKPEIIRGMAGD